MKKTKTIGLIEDMGPLTSGYFYNLILGYTELPLVFSKKRYKNVINCLDILADELLRKYYL